MLEESVQMKITHESMEPELQKIKLYNDLTEFVLRISRHLTVTLLVKQKLMKVREKGEKREKKGKRERKRGQERA